MTARKKGRKLRWVVLVFSAAIAVTGYFAYPYLTPYIPYTEYLPVRAKNHHTFGLDISHYQGSIKWSEVRESKHPIDFVFIRASMGKDGIDTQFTQNWVGAKEQQLLRGAYHYYRPNENSTEQFEQFKKQVKLEKGDLPPVLDIEELGHFGLPNLRAGLKNWLLLAEAHYGVKPIIYTGRNFYIDYLKGHVDGYPLWIAAYSGKQRLRGIDWKFHQFTERVRVNGIHGTVDGNDFNGEMEALLTLCIP